MASEPMTAEERRLLKLLAVSDDGCTAELLLALGFTPDLVLGGQKTYLPEDARSWCPGCGSRRRGGWQPGRVMAAHLRRLKAPDGPNPDRGP